MKKIIKSITENIRLPLMVLVSLVIVSAAVGQVQKPIPALQKKACGSYPANGVKVQGVSETYAGGNGCITIITPGIDTVYFSAHKSVLLEPGFIAKNGSRFIAYIDSSATTVSATATQAVVEKGNAIVSVSPNPFTSTVILSVNSGKDVRAQVTVYNAVGEMVKQQSGINISKGANKISLNFSGLANGVYTLELNFGDSKAMKKIIKSN